MNLDIQSFLFYFKEKLSSEVHQFVEPLIPVCNPFMLEIAFAQGLKPEDVDMEKLVVNPIGQLERILSLNEEAVKEGIGSYCDMDTDISCWLKEGKKFSVSGHVDLAPDYFLKAYLETDEIGDKIRIKFQLDTYSLLDKELEENFLEMFERVRQSPYIEPSKSW